MSLLGCIDTRYVFVVLMCNKFLSANNTNGALCTRIRVCVHTYVYIGAYVCTHTCILVCTDQEQVKMANALTNANGALWELVTRVSVIEQVNACVYGTYAYVYGTYTYVYGTYTYVYDTDAYGHGTYAYVYGTHAYVYRTYAYVYGTYTWLGHNGNFVACVPVIKQIDIYEFDKCIRIHIT